MAATSFARWYTTTEGVHSALTDDDKVLMVRQCRYALKEELWELPAGKLEKDEDPFEDSQA